MNREIILDTETTGLNPEESGIIEIAAIELINMVPSGDYFHCFINPKCAVEKGAFEVHGIGNEFLQDKPDFAEIVDDFLEYIGSSPLVIHNAAFDIGMLNAELGRIHYQLIDNPVVDTFQLARQRLPGQLHSLDALCNYYRIDLSARSKHSALVDVKLLADVYARLRGRQQELRLKVETDTSSLTGKPSGGNGIVRKASEEELIKHRAFMKESFSR